MYPVDSEWKALMAIKNHKMYGYDQFIGEPAYCGKELEQNFVRQQLHIFMGEMEHKQLQMVRK